MGYLRWIGEPGISNNDINTSVTYAKQSNNTLTSFDTVGPAYERRSWGWSNKKHDSGI
jgi:hypothetical protein